MDTEDNEPIQTVLNDSEQLGVSLERAKQTNIQLRAYLRVQQQETQDLRNQIQLHNHHQRDLATMFQFERNRYKSLPRTWTLSVIVHFVFMLQFWANFRFIPFLLNLSMFFLQWKRLYMPTLESSGTLSLAVLALTVYFYYGSSGRPPVTTDELSTFVMSQAGGSGGSL